MKTQKTYKSFFSIKQTLVLLFVTMLANTLFAQNATLSGNVSDDVEPLFGVTVQIKGTAIGGATDFDGNYTVNNVPLGNQQVIFNNMGMTMDTLYITIVAGQNTLDHLFTDAVELGVVEISIDDFLTDDAGESEAFLIEEALNNEQQQEIVGAEKLEKTGASDVADGVAQVSGVSKPSGRGSLVVRGLEDRYNNAFVNGLPVPSPNPDLKVIPLGLFPTSVVKSIEVSKVFNEKYYADYSGASIDIQTKNYTDTVGFFQVGLSGSANTVTTFKDFYTHADGQSELLGIDGGNRDMSSDLQTFDKNGDAVDSYETRTENPFSTGLNPAIQKALPGMGLSLAGGKFFAFKDSSRAKSRKKGIGVLLSLSTGNKASTILNGISRSYNAQNDSLSYLRFNKYTLSTSTSLIGSVIYKMNSKSNISYNILYVNDTENFTIEREGYIQDLGRENYVRRNAYFLNNVMNNQLLGTHEGEKFDILWGASIGTASSEEKDRKEVSYYADPEGYAFNGLNRPNNHRFWSALTETELAGRAAIKYHLYGKDSTGVKDSVNVRGNLTLGANYRSKKREFDFDQFNYDISFGEGQYVQNKYTPDENLNSDSLQNGGFYIQEQVAPESEYNATLDIFAAYLGFDYDITKKFKVLAGARLEQSKQVINFKTLRNGFGKEDFQTAEIDTFNVFPSLGFKYTPKEKTNLRFATSQTITRPKFTEVAPFLRQNREGDQEQGNPLLQNAYSYNADIKYETSKNYGELMSVTLFGRYLDSPIERIAQASSSTIYSYQNIESAMVAGLELEVSKNLANIVHGNKDLDSLELWTENVSLGGNFSYMYSQVTIPQDQSDFLTNTQRPLQGASPYLINFNASYDLKLGQKDSTTNKHKNTITFTLVYNVFGKRLYAVGVQKVDDVYEAPVNTLDFVVKGNLGKKFSVGFKARNLLNPTIQRESQAINEDRTLVLNSYKRGVSFSLSLGYKF